MTIQEGLEIVRRDVAAGKLAEAEQLCRRLVALAPGRPDVLCELGTVIGRQDRYDEAVEWLRRAIGTERGFMPGWQNLSVALEKWGKLGESADVIREMISMEPGNPLGYYRLAQVLRAAHEVDAGLAACRKSLELNPDDMEVHGVYSTLLLLNGEFEEGWREYETRWKCDSFPDKRREWSPIVLGQSPLEGKRVVIFAEQGFGDMIQFARYAPLLDRRGAEVVVACPQDVEKVMGWIKGVRKVVASKAGVPGDYQVPMMTLPMIFGTTLETIPAEIPYIIPPAELVEKWRRRMEEYKGLKVGIAWAGRPTHRQNKERTIRLEQLAELSQIEGITLFSLQKGPSSAELNPPPAGMKIINLTAGITDFADTAGLAANLDLIISVDTAVVHLAAAMGKPVWVLLPKAPDWRWLRDREDSPWYPTIRLFRQKEIGRWNEVVERVKSELKNRIG